MKRFSLALMLAGFLAGCSVGQPPVVDTVLGAATGTPTPAAAATPAALTSDSVYQLSSEWKDQDGKSLKLADLSGRVQVMAMVYSNCKGACPALINDMKVIEKKLDDPTVGFVLVSIDPEVDTPEKLKELARQKQLLGANWKLLRGNPDQVRELAAALNFQYARTSKTDYAHSNLITVLNAGGEIMHQQTGLGTDPSATLKVIEERDCCHKSK